MNKLMLVLISLTTFSGCAVTGDRPDEFAAKALIGTVLNETGLGTLAGVQMNGSVQVKTGARVVNTRGDEIVLLPRTNTTVRVP
jgi:hypothetical protein